MNKIMKFESYHSNSSNKKELKKGDIVLDTTDSRNRVGLIISDKYKNEDGEYGFDVYFRMLNGDIFFENEHNMELYNPDDDNYHHIPAYISIGKKNNYIVNIPNGYDDDGYLITQDDI